MNDIVEIIHQTFEKPNIDTSFFMKEAITLEILERRNRGLQQVIGALRIKKISDSVYSFCILYDWDKNSFKFRFISYNSNVPTGTEKIYYYSDPINVKAFIDLYFEYEHLIPERLELNDSILYRKLKLLYLSL